MGAPGFAGLAGLADAIRGIDAASAAAPRSIASMAMARNAAVRLDTVPFGAVGFDKDGAWSVGADGLIDGVVVT
jgi:hypothetical protein